MSNYETFYSECWRVLRSFLLDTLRDDTCEQLLRELALDVLNLMDGIEINFDRS